jgi:hypothetical protein
MVGAYNIRRKRNPKTYADDTFGSLVHWYTHEYPSSRSAQTPKADYRAAFNYLESEFDAPLNTITQQSFYEAHDQCVNDKWPRFADKMMAAMSSMFRQAVKRGKMPASIGRKALPCASGALDAAP